MNYLSRIAMIASTLGLFALIADFGFNQNSFYQEVFDGFYFIVLGFGIISTIARYVAKKRFPAKSVFAFDLVSIGFSLWVFYLYLFVGVPFETDLMLENPIWVQIAVVLTFIREFSELRINYKHTALVEVNSASIKDKPPTVALGVIRRKVPKSMISTKLDTKSWAGLSTVRL